MNRANEQLNIEKETKEIVCVCIERERDERVEGCKETLECSMNLVFGNIQYNCKVTYKTKL